MRIVPSGRWVGGKHALPSSFRTAPGGNVSMATLVVVVVAVVVVVVVVVAGGRWWWRTWIYLQIRHSNEGVPGCYEAILQWTGAAAAW